MAQEGLTRLKTNQFYFYYADFNCFMTYADAFHNLVFRIYLLRKIQVQF